MSVGGTHSFTLYPTSPGVQEVAGSSPAPPTFVCATICSMIERLNAGSPYTPNCFTMVSEVPYTLK